MSLSVLLSLADSRLPVGGHVHSGGVEEAVTAGLVFDLKTLDAFLRRRIVTTGAVAGSISAAVAASVLTVDDADSEYDARTPSPAARAASRSQGRGLRRLAVHTWPTHSWDDLGLKPHAPVAAGAVGRFLGLGPTECALVQVYTTMTGSATAAQRLLALDPADVAALTFGLSGECDEIAARVGADLPDLCDTTDPLMDFLAERHRYRERPLFAS